MFWWQYAMLIGGGAILGVFLSAITYFIFSWIQNRKLKKMLPTKDKKEISKWLKQEDTKKVLLNPGNVNITDTKEAEQNERERFDKYREFEKLRRISQGKPSTNYTATIPELSTKPTERGSISNKFDFGDATAKSKPKRKFDFD
jgi:hypothetical protein